MRESRPFTISYVEGSVLVTALTIAIQQLEARFADARMELLREETGVQLRVSRAMLARLLGDSD